MQANKPRFMALAQELGLAPMQLHALRLIEPEVEVPMSSLAGKLSATRRTSTGIVDRLEARGLIERRPAEHDRRVKLLVLTAEGERVRSIAHRQMHPAPSGDRGASARAQAGAARRAARGDGHRGGGFRPGPGRLGRRVERALDAPHAVDLRRGLA